MNYFLPGLLLVLPTILVFACLNNTKLINNRYLLIAFSWFGGQYLVTWFCYFLALILNLITGNLLFKAGLITALFLLVSIYPVKNELVDLISETYKYFKKIKRTVLLANILIVFFLLLFSILFFINQLAVDNSGKIYTSQIYWDFQWHMPLIQSFAYGDNFPPENESFAGFPATYHYFWGLMVAIYNTAGLGLVGSVNTISIICLFFMMLAVIGFSEEIFKTKSPGIIAVIFILTSSSLRFIYDLPMLQRGDISAVLQNFVFTTAHPYANSFVMGNPFGYNGTMFNMFYLLAERQMIPGIIYLIFIAWIIYRKDRFSRIQLFILGIAAGGYFLWHLYITIMALCSVLLAVVFSRDRKQLLPFLASFLVIFIGYVIYFKILQQSSSFMRDIASYPRINLNFPTMNQEYTLSLINFLGYYLFAYGLKVAFVLSGFILFWKKRHKALMVMTALILPAFILVNTIQLSPLSIYDNHKWLRPLNVFIDIVAAYCFYYVFFRLKKLPLVILSIPFLALLTMSGLIELIPFLNSRPTSFFVSENSELTKVIKAKTTPKAVFVGDDSREIQLAGRKLFLGNYSGQDLRLDSGKRQLVISEIYSAEKPQEICRLAVDYGIDYIEYKTGSELPATGLQYLLSRNANNETVKILEIRSSCRDSAI